MCCSFVVVDGVLFGCRRCRTLRCGVGAGVVGQEAGGFGRGEDRQGRGLVGARAGPGGVVVDRYGAAVVVDMSGGAVGPGAEHDAVDVQTLSLGEQRAYAGLDGRRDGGGVDDEQQWRAEVHAAAVGLQG